MDVRSRKLITIVVILLGLTLVNFQTKAAPIDDSTPFKLETFKSHSRLSVRLDKGIKTELSEEKSSLKIFFPAISLFDLGAPFGSEKAWLERYLDIKDYRLERLEVKEDERGVELSCYWKFPTGDKELHQPKMEMFSFRRSDEPWFVLDFWLAKRPTLAEVQSQQKQEQAAVQRQKNQEREEARKTYERQLASAEPLVLPEPDIQDFCKVPKNAEDDVFLPFHPVHEKVDFNRWFSLATPDSNYPYLEPLGNSKEAEYVRLALRLYRGGKPALAIRTVEFFDKEIGRSEFSDQMLFLKANALIKLGHNEKAYEIFKKLVDSPSNSPVILNSGMYMAGRSFKEDKHLIALDYFNRLIRKFPNHRLTWVFHLGAAECLYAIGDSQRSAAEYSRSIELAPSSAAQAEAAARLGDIYITHRQYEQALATYFRVIQHYEGKTQLPVSLLVNRAESLFWLDQPERSEKELRELLEKHAAYPESWRASLRLGELLSSSKDPKKRGEAVSWYRHTINHYPSSPGVLLARIRLAECGEDSGLTSKALSRLFTGEAEAFPDAPSSRNSIMMTKYQDLLGLYHVRALASKGSYGETVKAAIKRLRKVTRNQTIKQMSRTLKIAFFKETKALLDTNKGFEALAYYQKHIDSIPKDDNPIPPQFLLQLSRHAVDMGFASLAQKILKSFDHYKQSYLSKFTLDKVSQERLDSEVHYTFAKVDWVHSGVKKATEIRKQLAELSPDSFYQSEKETILSLLAHAEGNEEVAINHAVRAEMLLSKLSDEPIKTARLPELRLWIADLRKKSGEASAAASLYKNLQSEESMKGREVASGSHPQTGDLLSLSVLGLRKLPVQQELALAEAEAFVNAKEFRSAADAYSKAVDAGVTEARVLFAYAKALRNTGDNKDFEKSKQVLKLVLDGKSDNFWKKMAQEVLDGTSHL